MPKFEKKSQIFPNWISYQASSFHRANISDVLGNEFTVKGLTEGKEYEFRVAALNNAGVGDYSECSEAIKARPAPGKSFLPFLIL